MITFSHERSIRHLFHKSIIKKIFSSPHYAQTREQNRRCSTAVQKEHFFKWANVMQSLMPAAGNITYTFVTKLLHRIYRMLPDADKRDIARTSHTHSDRMECLLPFLTKQGDLDPEPGHQFLTQQINAFRDCLAQMLLRDDWETIYCSDKWVNARICVYKCWCVEILVHSQFRRQVRLVTLFSTGLHDQLIYSHYRPILNDPAYTNAIETLLTASIDTECHAMQSMLYPLLISQHINYRNDDERSAFARYFRTNEACYELMSYTHKIIRANSSRTKAELPNLAALLRFVFHQYKYDNLVNDRLVQLQCISLVANVKPDACKLDVVVPEYVATGPAFSQPMDGGYRRNECGCNWRECFTGRCNKTAAEVFEHALQRVKLDVHRMQRVLTEKNANLNLERHIDDIVMIREVFDTLIDPNAINAGHNR